MSQNEDTDSEVSNQTEVLHSSVNGKLDDQNGQAQQDNEIKSEGQTIHHMLANEHSDSTSDAIDAKKQISETESAVTSKDNMEKRSIDTDKHSKDTDQVSSRRQTNVKKNKKRGDKSKTTKEEKANEESSTSQTEEKTNEGSSTSQTEEKANEGSSTSQTEEKTNEGSSTSQTEEKANEGCSTSQTEEKTNEGSSTSQTVHDVADSDDDEGICLGDATDLDSDGRNKMFERGLSFERNGKINKALKCYMACLTGLTQTSRFALLPQCLRNIADIYYQKEQYEKAVHFIQAEKVFYESALVDTRDIQSKLEEAQLKESALPITTSTDTVRASEYEHLARLCLDRDQPQLALEYAGKATKLRQQILGDKDPVTVESLDFFASVYAKVGAEQYGESLKKLSENPEDEEIDEGSKEGTGDQKEPVSILRKRKNTKDIEMSEREKKVHFDESQLQSQEQKQNEERFAKSVLWGLLVICSILLLILGMYLYCHLVGSHTCNQLKGDLYYGYMRVKYWYYQHYSGPNSKFM